jgi:hypothetical protein
LHGSAGSAEELGKQIASEMKNWATVARDANIKTE